MIIAAVLFHSTVVFKRIFHRFAFLLEVYLLNT